MPVHHEDREPDEAPPVRLVDAQGRDVIAADGTIALAPVRPVAINMLRNAAAAITSPVVDRGMYRGPCALVMSNVAGGSPTVNVDIQGSVNGTHWYNVAYALVATPNTVAVAQIAITSTATTTYLLLTDQAWRFLRITTSTVNNDVLTVDFYI